MSKQSIATECYGSSPEKVVYSLKEDGAVIATRQSPHSSMQTSVRKFFKSAFLPQGYPESVSDDYIQYQLWDTMQAFCSSITGMLATQAMLKGYGVGDETATAAAATITWMLKNGAGMVGNILFAWLQGTRLDCDAKRWRLHADILNDVAIMLDLIAPIFKSYFVLIACISSIARSIVGVAGGATRAALTLHQARRDNMADVSAKDGSQETLVNLLALLAGFIITPLVSGNQPLVWMFFILFTFLHLFANYQAVSAVVMETINKPRMYIVMDHYLRYKQMLKPAEVSKVDPVLRRPGYACHICVGVPLKYVVKSAQDFDNLVGSSNSKVMYLVQYDNNASTINVVLHKNTTNTDIRRSCFHALLLDIIINKRNELHTFHKDCHHLLKNINGNSNFHDQNMKDLIEKLYPQFEKQLESHGWDLSRCHLGLDEWRSEWDKKNM